MKTNTQHSLSLPPVLVTQRKAYLLGLHYTDPNHQNIKILYRVQNFLPI